MYGTSIIYFLIALQFTILNQKLITKSQFTKMREMRKKKNKKHLITSFYWGSPEKEIAKSQRIWHRKDPSLLKGHTCQAQA